MSANASLIQAFTHLKKKSKPDEALALLKRVASLVKPIMKDHGWSLPCLAEFFPTNPGLLGMNINSGQKIFLRLRPASAEDTFYDTEQLVLVMLHELAHNAHGPHNEMFYALLSKLEAEYDALRSKGYSGEGFVGEGRRVGEGSSHNVPLHEARRKALEAANRRRRLGGVMGGPGRKLGSGTESKQLAPREAAAWAAERRARDEKTCASVSVETIRQEVEKALEESSSDVSLSTSSVSSPPPPSTAPTQRTPTSNIASKSIQNSRQNDPNHTVPIRRARTPSPDARPPSKRPRLAPSPAIPQRAKPSSHSPSSEWPCAACTFLNRPLALQCSVCATIRPLAGGADWLCLGCGEEANEALFWTCKGCGRMKAEAGVPC